MLRDVLTETADDDALQSTRPALARLTLDVSETVIHGPNGLLTGFDSRRALIEWEQRLVVRTLGEFPQAVLREIGGWLAAPRDRVELQVFLTEHNSSSGSVFDQLDDPEAGARRERERFRRMFIEPAFERAYRKLRGEASDYADANPDGSVNPAEQRYIAMRPGLDELDRWQQAALTRFLDGIQRSAFSDWGHVLESATHGEPIRSPDGTEHSVTAFVTQLDQERATRRVVTGEHPQAAAERALIAARLLIPSFNRGVRTRFGYSGETSAREPTSSDRSIPHG